MADPKKTPGMTADAYLMLCLQNGGPMSVADLAAFAGRSESSVRFQLGKLRNPACRQVRIKSWDHPVPPSGQYSAVYELGSHPDARKPKGKTDAEKCRQYHAKRSAIRALEKRQLRGTAVPASPWDALLRQAA